MFEIHINDNDVTGGSIPISWCIDKEELADLARHAVKDPQVVICVAPVENYHPSKEQRQIVPLKDLMAYVQFRCSGANRIWAFVSYKSAKEARRTYFGRGTYGNFWDHAILTPDGDAWADWLAGTVGDTKPLLVDVPEACFAPAPPEWEKRWVNHFFLDKPVDQCHYRRRKIFGYTAQPIIFLALMMFRLMMLVLAGAWLDKGWWELCKQVFQPLTYEIADLFKCLGGPCVVPSLSEREKQVVDHSPAGALRVIFPRLLCLLITPIGLCLLAKLFMSGHMAPIGGSVVGILALVFVLFHIIEWTIDGKLGSLFPRLYEWLSDLVPSFTTSSSDYWYQKSEEEQLLICNGTTKPTDVASLPKQHRTLKLRFQQLKSQVCKPFAR